MMKIFLIIVGVSVLIMIVDIIRHIPEARLGEDTTDENDENDKSDTKETLEQRNSK